MDASFLWSGGASAIVGGLIGSSVPLFRAAAARRQERAGEVIGMQTELHLAHIQIDALLTDGISAPLYRLPTSIFQHALPKLIGEKHLEPNHIGLLVEYLNRVEELNRGLDRAGQASLAGDRSPKARVRTQ